MTRNGAAKDCRPFSGTAGLVIFPTAVPSSAGTLTRSEMRPSSVLNSSPDVLRNHTAGSCQSDPFELLFRPYYVGRVGLEPTTGGL